MPEPQKAQECVNGDKRDTYIRQKLLYNMPFYKEMYNLRVKNV